MFQLYRQRDIDETKREMLEDFGAFLKTLHKTYKEEMMSFCMETKRMKKHLVSHLEEKHEEAIQKKQEEMEALLLNKETEFQEKMSEAFGKCYQKGKDLELALQEKKHRMTVLDSNSAKQIQEIRQELQAYKLKVVKAKELAIEQLQEMKQELETKVNVIKTKESASENGVLKVMEEEIRSSVLFLLKNILMSSESIITSQDTSLRQKESEISSLYTIIEELMKTNEKAVTENSLFVMSKPKEQIDSKICICASARPEKWSNGDKFIKDKHQKEKPDTVGVDRREHGPKKTLVLPEKEKERHQSPVKNDFLGYVAEGGQFVWQEMLKRVKENIVNFMDAEGEKSASTLQALENKTESPDPNLLPEIDGCEKADVSHDQGNTNDWLFLKKVNRQGTTQRRSQLRSYQQNLKKRIYKQ